MSEILYGYAGQILRADLSAGLLTWQPITPDLAAKWVGGTLLGARLLFEETPAGVEWDDPESRVILASGPLGGTRVAGTGTSRLPATADYWVWDQTTPSRGLVNWQGTVQTTGSMQWVSSPPCSSPRACWLHSKYPPGSS